MTYESRIRVLADIVRLHAAERRDNIAMVYRGRTTTFGELDRRSSQTANGLINEGLPPQARIALLDKNSDTFFEIFFGATKANVVLVSVNWRLAPVEIAYIINDSRAEILFVGEEYITSIDSIRGELEYVKKIIAITGSQPEWESFDGWRDRQSESEPDVKIDESDVAIQLYTSGTTGHPKGAEITNTNLLVLLPTAVREWGKWSDADVNLVCMPLFHIGGTGYASIGFYVGARSVIIRDVVPAEILRAIESEGVTKSFFVPAVLLFLLQTPGVEEMNLGSLDLIIYGASPIPLDLLRRSMAVFGCKFAQVYGLTETTGAVTWLPPEDHDPNGSPRMLSCGRPQTGVELRIVDADGNQLPAGDVGEIICRSPQNMKGYWNLPEETAKVKRGAWLHTGDAGYLDDSGYLYIYDRIKDMIVSGGENIYPAEVESVIFAHPGVADVAVIGVPDDVWGEAVKAVVVRKPGQEVSETDIIAYARERMAHYKAPRSVDFAEALPRNPSGKLLKRELRSRYWEGRKRQVN
jgi:acyl-CoA synthetase (AMP-forming)/AMP-acid ligase II